MKQLSKRWEPLKSAHNGRLHRAFLPEVNGGGLRWGCIEAPSLDGPFRLEIWNQTEGEWDFVEAFPTFKQAKAVGRLLAGVALSRNM
jgi:hypothetical protein